MERQHKVIFASRVFGSNDGGSAFSKAFVETLLQSRFHVTLLAERIETLPEGPLASELDRVELKYFFRPGIRNWLARLVDIPRFLKAVLLRKRPLVIVQGDLPRITYVLLQLFVPLLFIRQDGILTCPANHRFLPRSRKCCKKPPGFSCLAVNTKEGCLESIPFLQRIGRITYRVRDRFLLHLLRHFTVNSAHIARSHGRDDATIIYPPNLSLPSSKRPSERKLKQLIHCGRMEGRGKGADDAIQMLAALPTDYRLVLLGDGPHRGLLEKQVRDLGLEARVRFLGWVNAGTRDAMLAESGVLLVPSLWEEAFGMVGIEAFTQGTPAVAYDVGGISEWCLPSAGMLVACGDIKGATAAILQLTSSPETWQRFSDGAFEIATKSFPRRRFQDKLLPLIQQLTGVSLR